MVMDSPLMACSVDIASANISPSGISMPGFVKHIYLLSRFLVFVSFLVYNSMKMDLDLRKCFMNFRPSYYFFVQIDPPILMRSYIFNLANLCIP